MTMKKKIPIGVRKALEEVAKNKNYLFYTEFKNDVVIILKDKETSSDFHFSILKINPPTNAKESYNIEYKPCILETLESKNTNTTLEGLKNHFSNWIKLLEDYNEESPLFGDPILQTYYDELEPDFKILDDDADIKPYSIEQQKKIVLFLENASQIIHRQEPLQNNEIKEFIELVNETKENISKSTKRQVINKIRKIIAKGFKIGLQVGERLLIEFTAEVTKQMIMGN